jgi:hypothetical protein
MRKIVRILVIVAILILTGFQMRSQTMQVHVSTFCYVLTDPSWQQGDHYDVNIFLTNSDQSYWASQTYLIGTYSTPGTYCTSTSYLFWMYHESYFDVNLQRNFHQ